MEDSRGLAGSIALTVAGILGGLLYCTVVYGHLHGHPSWWRFPADWRMISPAGLQLVHGHLKAVYSMNRSLYSLPLSLPLTGLTAATIGWLHLPTGPQPEWVWVAVPAICAPGALVLYQVRRLASDLGVRRRLFLIQALTALLMFVPLVEWGHVEDILALGFVIPAIRRLLKAEYVPACLYLSLAVSSKQWAVMLVPLAVFAAPGGSRLRCALASVALPVALASIFLAVDFHDAWPAFTSPTTYVKNYPGHPSLFGTWLGSRSSQVDRIAVTAVATGLAWWRRDRLAEPSDVVVLAGAILLLRTLAESISYPYYWTPGLILLLVAVAARAGRPRPAECATVLAIMCWTVPVSNDVTNMDWWAGEVLLLALLAYLVIRSRARVGADRRDPLPATGRPAGVPVPV